MITQSLISPNRIASDIREVLKISDPLEQAIAINQIRQRYRISLTEMDRMVAIARWEVKDV